MKSLLSLLLITCCICPGFSQKAVDSLMKKANFEIYEHPEQTIEIAKSILNGKNTKLKDRIDALLLVSTAYSSQRNYAKSLEFAVKASQLLPKIESDAFKIIVYSRLGIQYQQLKIYDKAHAYLDQAIAVANHTKQQFNAHKLLGFNYAIRGMVYKEQMSCDIAQNYFNKSLYHYSKSTKESINYSNISVIVYNKGNCFIAMNEIDSARICFTDSYNYADKIKANSLKAFADKGLAEVSTLEGNYPKAIRLLSDAEKMSEGVGDLVLNQGIYKGLSDNYLLTNAMKLQEQYVKKYDAITTQIKTNNAKTLNQFVKQINSANQKQMQQLKSNALSLQIPFLAPLLLLLAALCFDIYSIRKTGKQLQIQKEKLENPFLYSD